MTTPGSPPLRILHVIPDLSAETGGPPMVCAGLAAALAARGHQVAIATLDQPGKNPIPIDERVVKYSFPPDKNGKYAPSQSLDRWLRIHIPSFDIVHLHSLWQFPTYAAARACWHTRKPYVVLLNGMLDRYSVYHRSRWIKHLYWLLCERKIEGRAAGLHCLNTAEIRRAVSWIRDIPKFIIPNGIDASQFSSMPPRGEFRAAHPEFTDKFIALFLSRLHPKKGLDRLIPAWKYLASSRPDARLLIAGTGDPDYVASLQKLVAENGLQREVLFLGQLIGREKWRALVDADLFVLPSHQEGFSMAITEALAAGCPPVVTEECNYDELEPPPPNPPAGVIIKNGDMQNFTSEIARLIDDPQRRRRMADAGKSLVAARFTWQKVAGELEQIYRDILAGKKLPAH